MSDSNKSGKSIWYLVAGLVVGAAVIYFFFPRPRVIKSPFFIGLYPTKIHPEILDTALPPGYSIQNNDTGTEPFTQLYIQFIQVSGDTAVHSINYGGWTAGSMGCSPITGMQAVITDNTFKVLGTLSPSSPSFTYAPGITYDIWPQDVPPGNYITSITGAFTCTDACGNVLTLTPSP